MTRTRRATQDRHNAVLALLEQGVVDVEGLAAGIGVSPSTVRRDLSRLERDGLITRTYGGALVRERFHERSFSESEQLHRAAKSQMATVAVDLVPEGGTVFLDAGTTCLAVARLLADLGPRTVFTRGLEAALLLARSPQLDVVLLGGQVRPLSHGLVGPFTVLALDRVSFDVAFLGADVLDPERGLGEPSLEETSVKEQAADCAARVVLLADASKLRAAPGINAWVPTRPSWTVVTDSSADPQALSALRATGVRVLTTPGDLL